MTAAHRKRETDLLVFAARASVALGPESAPGILAIPTHACTCLGGPPLNDAIYHRSPCPRAPQSTTASTSRVCEWW